MKMKILFLPVLCVLTNPLVAMVDRRRPTLIESYFNKTGDNPNSEKILVLGTALTVTLSTFSLVSAIQGYPKTALCFGTAAAASVTGTVTLPLLPLR
jgi:hypothetical protein